MSLFDYYRDALDLIDDGGLSSLGQVDTRYNSRNDLWDVNLQDDTTGNTTGVPIPYSYERQRVPNTYAPDRRPGSRGQRYFSDGVYMANTEATPEKRAEVQTAYTDQANNAYIANLANRTQQQQFEAQPQPAYTPSPKTSMGFGAYKPRANGPSGAAAANPAPTRNDLMAFLAQERAKQKGGGGTGLEDFLDGARTGTGETGSGIAGLAGGGPAGSGPSSAYNRRYNGYATGGIMSYAEGAEVENTLPKLGDLTQEDRDRIKINNRKAMENSPLYKQLLEEYEDNKNNEEGAIAAFLRREAEDEERRSKSSDPATPPPKAPRDPDVFSKGGMPQAQGYYLGGATDGMADNIPARIDNNQEARLSDGEFVVPADVVSHLGNGNSSAGAKNLYGMMDRVRTARTGNKEQGKQIDPNKFMPSRTV